MSERLCAVLAKPGLQMRKGQAIARPEFVARMDGSEQIAALPEAAKEVFKKFLIEEALVAHVGLKDALVARPFEAGEEAGGEPEWQMTDVALERMRFKREGKDGQPETKLYFVIEGEGREGQLWAARNCGKKLWVRIKSQPPINPPEGGRINAEETNERRT